MTNAATRNKIMDCIVDMDELKANPYSLGMTVSGLIVRLDELATAQSEVHQALRTNFGKSKSAKPTWMYCHEISNLYATMEMLHDLHPNRTDQDKIYACDILEEILSLLMVPGDSNHIFDRLVKAQVSRSKMHNNDAATVVDAKLIVAVDQIIEVFNEQSAD